MKRLIAALAHPRQYVWFALRPWRRHSLVLAVAGLLYVFLGLTYIITPVDPARAEAFRIPLLWLPLPVWGCLWVTTGLLAIISARWPPASETWGYSAMAGTAALWASFLAGGVALGAPATNLTGTLVFALLAFLWWAIAGLLNPDDLPVPPGEGTE